MIERDGDAVILRPPKRSPIAELINALNAFETVPEREQPCMPDTRESW